MYNPSANPLHKYFDSELRGKETNLIFEDTTLLNAKVTQILIFRFILFQVDVDQCQETAAGQGVTAMPTFMFFRNKTKLDKIQGADNKALEEMVMV